MATRTNIPSADVLDWLERRVHDFRDDDLAAYRDSILDGILAALPELAADEETLAEARRGADESLRLFVRLVLAGPGSAASEPPVGAVEIARGLVRHGVDVGVLLKAYRVGQSLFWRRWMRDVGERIEDPDLRMAVLERSWDRVSVWFESQVAQLSEQYAAERESWLHSALARRTEIVRELLAGEAVDLDLASQTLSHELRRWQTAFVLWTTSEGDHLDLLNRTAQDLAAALGASRALTIPVFSTAQWTWVATASRPDRERLRDVDLHARDPALRVAAGRPASGPAGFRSSHHQAELARRVADAAGSAGAQLVLFEEVELAALMSSEPEGVRELIASELGGLARRDAATARLRDTARVFLACGSNAPDAAVALHAHKNTIHYRLRRIEELLGHPIGERRLQLEVALTLVHVLGDDALPDEGRR